MLQFMLEASWWFESQKAHVWYIKILAWLRGFLVIFLWLFDLVFFVLKSLLGITRQWSHEKFAIFTLKPRSDAISLLVSKIKMIGRNAIERCVPSSPHLESDVLHNHSTPLTVIKLTQRIKLRNLNTTAITKKHELLTIIF